jgi:predicted lipoprotein with Yx(FWY)xxD motif
MARILALLLLVALMPGALAAAPAAHPQAAKIKVSHKSPYGVYLTDAGGRSLYIFMADRNTHGSACHHRCIAMWPPYVIGGKALVGAHLDASKVGTIKRKNGRVQVTYNGWPLYFFAKDNHHPGATKGEGITGFGGKWYLVSPKGKQIEAGKHRAKSGTQK